jgi:penicillin-binding protein 1A
VRALSGGYAYGLSHFNCATQARRQTGSAFKPIVYAAALESGYTPKSIINDMPVSYKLGPGMGYYTPKNYSGKSYGPSPLKDGIIFSRNMMTVNLAKTMGVGRIKKLAQKLGAMDNMPLELSMSLGAGESTLMRMVTAYSSLVNGGYKVIPENILVSPHPFAPQTRTMITWEERSNTPSPQKTAPLEEIISAGNSQIITDMLKEVVERGTAQRLKPLQEEAGLIIGGKTGTTNSFKDAWFIGFTESPSNRKRYVIGVFVGYPIPKSLGIDENGSRVAIPLFEIFVRKAQERLKH